MGVRKVRPSKPRGRLRSASAGVAAAAATVWALQEPIDQRLLRCDYSDIAVLGKAVTRGPGWRAAGLAMLTEHICLYPLCSIIDRHHPARGEFGIPPLLTNSRAFLQATWRHALFGTVLGRLG